MFQASPQCAILSVALTNPISPPIAGYDTKKKQISEKQRLLNLIKGLISNLS